MTHKERLEKLIINAKIADSETESFTEFFAEYLLANGVIVPPCIYGKTVFLTRDEAEKALEERRRNEC